ncbi:hypothetical protein M0R04_16230, partial [Candidatus Dojkabacteria bacterium]|nr:hypothetical protein [Candidatus Dojkabacteria bacterium]
VDSNNVKNCAYIRYAKSQSIKYGLKGTRLKALENAVKFFQDLNISEDVKLDDYMFDIVQYVDDSDYCDIKYDDKGLKFLYLCGKMHQNTTSVPEFIRRVSSAWQEYGHRARKAMESDGIDWKAISHCMRAIYQTQELLQHGKITFPLAKSHEILRIKCGEIPWPIVEKMIESGLEDIENMDTKFNGVWDQDYVDNCVLTLYDLL